MTNGVYEGNTMIARCDNMDIFISSVSNIPVKYTKLIYLYAFSFYSLLEIVKSRISDYLKKK